MFSSSQVWIGFFNEESLSVLTFTIFFLLVIMTIFILIMFSSRLTEAAAQLSVLSSVICGEEPTSVRGELLRLFSLLDR